MGRLQDRVALITGGASGIGAACARLFAEEGARIAGLDIAKPEDGAWEPVQEAAPDATFHVADVSREDDVARAVAEIATHFGRVDVLVNAAGVAGGGPVHTVASEEWDRVLDINLKGTFLACKHALGPMLERNDLTDSGREGVLWRASARLYDLDTDAIARANAKRRSARA